LHRETLGTSTFFSFHVDLVSVFRSLVFGICKLSIDFLRAN
jgi:hypothetical protein